MNIRLAGSTLLITSDGIKSVEKCEVENFGKVRLWNGERWDDVVITKIEEYKTDDFWRIKISDGSFIDVQSDFSMKVLENESGSKTTNFVFKDHISSINDGRLDSRLFLKIKKITYPSNKDFKEQYSNNDPMRDEIAMFPYDYGFFTGVGEFSAGKGTSIPSVKIFQHNFNSEFVSAGKAYEEFSIYDKFNRETKLARRIFLKDLDDQMCKSLINPKKRFGGFHRAIFGLNKNQCAEFFGGYFDAKAFILRDEKIRIVDGKNKIFDLQLILSKLGIDSVIRVLGKDENGKMKNGQVYALDIYNPVAIATQREDLNMFDCKQYVPKNQSIKFVKKIPADVGLYSITGKSNQYVIGNILVEK